MRSIFILTTILFCTSYVNGSVAGDTIIIIQNKTSSDSTLVFKNTQVDESCDYLSPKEKEIIQYINIARMYPKWFVYFFKINPNGDSYESSLYNTLMHMQPISQKLIPSKDLWLSAKCHAETSGKVGYVGHTRQSNQCRALFAGECCNYGNDDPGDVVLELLVDRGVESLGHRRACLMVEFKKIGVSTMPHTIYSETQVLDFGR